MATRTKLLSIAGALALLGAAFPGTPAQSEPAPPPRRIVSLAPSLTEILFVIGAGDEVAGVTSFCDWPPEALSRPKVGGYTSGTVSVETIVSLEPDLVLTGGRIHEPVSRTLAGLGIRVVDIEARRLADVYADIEQLGRITGHAAQAARLVSRMKDRIAAVAEAIRSIPPEDRPAVFYELWNEPLMTAGRDSFVSEVVDLAGGRNVFAGLPGEFSQVSAESVVLGDPEVILGSTVRGMALDPRRLAERPGWAEIRAVKSGRIHLLDGGLLSRPGPRLADAVEAVARALHPELFGVERTNDLVQASPDPRLPGADTERRP